MAPTQMMSELLTKPSVNRPPAFASLLPLDPPARFPTFLCSQSPKRFKAPSISMSCPATVPATMETMSSMVPSTCSVVPPSATVSMAPRVLDPPMNTTHRPRAWVSVRSMAGLTPRLSPMPMRLPTSTAAVFARVPR